MSNKKQHGMTLIELMIVVLVLAVIAAIATPSFLDQVRKARRSDAKQALMDVATRMEQYYQDNKGYPVGGNMLDIGYDNNPYESPEGHYNISFSAGPTTTTYTAQAVPKGDQAKDKTCQTFRIDNTGQKTVTKGNAKDCW